MTKSLARLALLVGCLWTHLSWAQSVASRQACPNEVREVLAAALRLSLGDVPAGFVQERLDRKSPVIPDYNVLPLDHPVYVRISLEDPKCSIDASVLPKSGNRTFQLVDDEKLRSLARRGKNGVTYVRATRVNVSDDEVVVALGTAARLPPGDTRGLVCCCGGYMVLQRAGGNWRFVEWRQIECA